MPKRRMSGESVLAAALVLALLPMVALVRPAPISARKENDRAAGERMCNRVAVKLLRRVPSVVVLITLLVLIPLLAACDISVARQDVVVVTATKQSQSQDVVVTDTPTQGVVVQPPTADVQATVQAAVDATIAARPTDTEVPTPPSAVPLTPDLQTPLQATVQLTEAAAPTNTPKPTAKRTAAYPSPQVTSGPYHSRGLCDDGWLELSWYWAGTLGQDEYYDVQFYGVWGGSGAAEWRGITWSKAPSCALQCPYHLLPSYIPKWCDGGGGSGGCVYRWRVAVVTGQSGGQVKVLSTSDWSEFDLD